MFETAVVSYGPASKRVWTTFAGMTGQCALVALAVLVPLTHPSALQIRETLIPIFAPTPPPSPRTPGGPQVTAQTAAPRPTQIFNGQLVAPVRPPERAQIIEDPPVTAFANNDGREIGVIGGTGDPGGGGNVVTNLLKAIPPTPVARPVERPVTTAAAPSAAIPRYTVGGNVFLGAPIRRVEPAYPAPARNIRAAGDVKLEAVVGIDGRVKELRVLSGNPLLIKAAVDAVRQWVYAPSTLNGEPIEVVSPITVTFRLN